MANMDGVSHGGMTATIVMATYNGRQFLREQLDSIVSQVRQADEVVIVDDCSSDGTPEYIDAYINEHGLKDTWRIYRNEKNLGFVGNYLKGCSLATGDVIFFSDQDDVWADGKISEMMAVFERHEDALVVSCDTTIIDQDDRSDNTFQTSLRRTKEGVWKVDFGQQVSSMLSSGLTLGVKRSFMDDTSWLDATGADGGAACTGGSLVSARFVSPAGGTFGASGVVDASGAVAPHVVVEPDVATPPAGEADGRDVPGDSAGKSPIDANPAAGKLTTGPTANPALKPASATTKTTTTITKTTGAKASKSKTATVASTSLPKTGDNCWIAASMTLFLLGTVFLAAACRC